MIRIDGLGAIDGVLLNGTLELEVDLLQKCGIILFDHFELGVVVDNLQGFHVGVVDEGELDVRPCRALQQVEDG